MIKIIKMSGLSRKQHEYKVYYENSTFYIMYKSDKIRIADESLDVSGSKILYSIAGKKSDAYNKWCEAKRDNKSLGEIYNYEIMYRNLPDDWHKKVRDIPVDSTKSVSIMRAGWSKIKPGLKVTGSIKNKIFYIHKIKH